MSSQGRNKKKWGYIYPLGNGTLHYPAAFRQSLVVNGYDLSTAFWTLRETIVEKVPVSVYESKLEELERPHEFLYV
jgi:hypothetical protein